MTLPLSTCYPLYHYISYVPISASSTLYARVYIDIQNKDTTEITSVMSNPDFFKMPISVGVIQIKSGYLVSLVPSYVIAAHISPPPTVWACEHKHRRRPNIRRGTNWPFPLVSNLAQFDLISTRFRVIREALHSSVYSRKSQA